MYTQGLFDSHLQALCTFIDIALQIEVEKRLKRTGNRQKLKFVEEFLNIQEY